MLPHPQGRAAEPRAGRRRRVGHGPAPRAVGHACGTARGRTGRSARDREVQPARRLDGSGRVGVPEGVRRAGQPAACARLPEHRLRAVYARDPPRRGQPGGPLVVGVARHEGMRAAHHDHADSRERRSRRRALKADKKPNIAPPATAGGTNPEEKD
ncbi:hypothetical protein BDI4_700083 [Burkholderia diffusa]|nr:hypothetical protein BDI4_700083 [Burkholderia diffusa]